MTLRKLLILFVSGCVGSLLFAQVAPKQKAVVEQSTAIIDTLELDSIRVYQHQLNAELRNIMYMKDPE